MEREVDAMAAEAARRVERAREVGDQLSLFGPPAPMPAPGEGEAGEGGKRIGRPPGARNKVKAQLRELMAAQGWRDPAQQLAYLAGLNSREDPYLVALGRAEALVASSEDGEGEGALERAERLLERAQGSEERKIAMRVLASAEERLAARAERVIALAGAILREMRQAADSLMPYVFAKLTPDVTDARQQMFVQVLAGGGAASSQAIGARLGPPPMPSDIPEGYQGLGDGAAAQSDGGQSDGGRE